ncbi:hypothetical protein D9M71_435210 [compost metagenome]
MTHRYRMPGAGNPRQTVGQGQGELRPGIVVLMHRQANVFREEAIDRGIQRLPAEHHLIGLVADLQQVLVFALPRFTAQAQVVVEVAAQLVVGVTERLVMAALFDQRLDALPRQAGLLDQGRAHGIGAAGLGEQVFHAYPVDGVGGAQLAQCLVVGPAYFVGYADDVVERRAVTQDRHHATWRVQRRNLLAQLVQALDGHRLAVVRQHTERLVTRVRRFAREARQHQAYRRLLIVEAGKADGQVGPARRFEAIIAVLEQITCQHVADRLDPGVFVLHDLSSLRGGVSALAGEGASHARSKRPVQGMQQLCRLFAIEIRRLRL